MPLVFTGGSGSNGTPFLLQVIAARSSALVGVLAGNAERAQVDQREMGVGAARDEVGAALLQAAGKRLGIGDDRLARRS